MFGKGKLFHLGALYAEGAAGVRGEGRGEGGCEDGHEDDPDEHPDQTEQTGREGLRSSVPVSKVNYMKASPTSYNK